jgi:esterase/lipase superfamily enzyme
MGNWVLTHTLVRLIGEKVGRRKPWFDQIVLAAPDIDGDSFVSDWEKRCHKLGKQCTLYAAKNDRALGYSRQINGNNPRAGYIDPKITLATGIDSIDASAVKVSFVAHRTYSESRPVINDLFCMVQHGHAPKDRALSAVPNRNKPRYWRFK